jgi:hypothetical protein
MDCHQLLGLALRPGPVTHLGTIEVRPERSW